MRNACLLYWYEGKLAIKQRTAHSSNLSLWLLTGTTVGAAIATFALIALILFVVPERAPKMSISDALIGLLGMFLVLVTLLVAMLGYVGYRNIKDAAIDAARTVAADVSKITAADTARTAAIDVAEKELTEKANEIRLARDINEFRRFRGERR